MFKIKVILIFTVLLTILAISPSSSNAAYGKITSSRLTVNLVEGQSQLIQYQLTQPIICPTPEETTTTTTTEPVDPENPNPPPGPDPEHPSTCKVRVTFVISDPSRVTTSVSQVTWLSNEWAQQRTMTVTALQDNVYNENNVVNVNGSAAESQGTRAVYYFDATVPLTINITDTDEAPSTTSTTSTDVQSLTPTIALSKNAVAPTNEITVTGSNFKADSEVTVTLHSTPTVLGTIRTNSLGQFSGTFTIPKNTDLGAHQIIVTGLNATGNEASSVQAITISQLASTGSNTYTFLYIIFCLTLFGSLLIMLTKTRNKTIIY